MLPDAAGQVLGEPCREAGAALKRALAQLHDEPVNPVPVRLAARFALCDKRNGFRRRTISGR